MGSSPSASSDKYIASRDITEVVKCMMPLYYHTDEVIVSDIITCDRTWQSIMNSSAACIPALRSLSPGRLTHGPELFREAFFSRFFNVHPAAEPMFSDAAVQSGKFIGSMIALCFTQLDDPKAFRKKVVSMAEDHCHMGVRTVEYGVVGDVLFHCIELFLGKEAYTRAVERSWLKIFSSLLRIIVPIAVTFERDCGRFHRAVQKRVATSKKNSMSRKLASSKLEFSKKENSAFRKKLISSKKFDSNETAMMASNFSVVEMDDTAGNNNFNNEESNITIGQDDQTTCKN
jgi:hemoglobin-like flavoprotein